MAKKTIEQVDVQGRRVLVRVDFNVPLDDVGNVTDDRRIRAAMPTIESVIRRGGRAIFMSHLGRPTGKGIEPRFSLEPVQACLKKMLAPVRVTFVPGDCVGADARLAVEALQNGEAVLLDNLRFAAGEKSGDAEFASKLASFGDVYCNDAFGTAHRNDASMYAVPKAMPGKPRVCGFLLARELKYLSETIERAKRPFIAVLGGAKVSDKLGAIENLLSRVDVILIGGAMAYTFLKARGDAIGASRVEEDMIDQANDLLHRAGKDGCATIELPIDHFCGRKLEAGTDTRAFDGAIEKGWMGLDVGSRTIAHFEDVIRTAKTIVWNGPMGVFELPPFDKGTRAVADAVARATGKGAVSVIGGGDSAAAIEAFGLANRVSHVSTGGGASLQMLEGKPFESVALLDEA